MSTAEAEAPARKRPKQKAAKAASPQDATAKTAEMRSGWPYRFAMVPVTDLGIDDSYQRPLTSFWVVVRDTFDPALVGTLIVSERQNGTKLIIDGQTRWTAMLEREVPEAPCLIYANLSKAQEAELFAALQLQRRAMRTYHRFRAELVARKADAVGIAKVVKAAGFELGTVEKPDTLQSVTALEKAYAVDPEHLGEVLTLIRDVWGLEDKDAVSAQIINGLSTFVRKQERLDFERLRDRLRDVTPRLLMNRAAQIREGAGPGTGAAGAIAQAILNEFMRRKR